MRIEKTSSKLNITKTTLRNSLSEELEWYDEFDAEAIIDRYALSATEHK